jgi:hypothetical protein
MNELKWRVDCKPGKQVFFETIAAFNCQEAAVNYLNECRNTNSCWAVYRVMTTVDGCEWELL